MAKTQQFTLVNVSGKMSTIAPLNTEVVVKLVATEHDPKALRAFLASDDNNNIGFIGDSKKAENSDVKGVLYDLMNKHDKLDGIRMMVVGFENIVVMEGSTNTVEVAILEVLPGEFIVEEPVLEGETVFELKVKGSNIANPKKSAVVQALLDNSPAEVTLKFDESTSEVLAIYDGGRAGVVDSESPGYDEAVKVLAHMKEMPASTKMPLQSTYIARMKVDEETIVFVKTGKRPLTLSELKEEKSSFIPMERLDRIEKYLEARGLSKKQIMKVMQTYKEYPAEIQARIPEPTVQFADSFGGVKKTIVYLNKGKHLRLIGEKGTGKNLLTTTLAWIYQRPLYELSMNAQTDKLDLLGSKTIDSTVVEGKEVTKIGFQKEALVEALEVGGFLNLDEVNTADPAVLVLLHSIVDDRGSIEVPSYGRVQADDNFGIILTMNVDYVGTTQLNEATRDRFTPILFPNNESIANLLKARVPSAKAEDIKLADRIYKDMMKLVQNNNLSMDCITIRGFIDALEVIEDLGIEEAMIDSVANRIEEKEYRLTVTQLIDKVVG